MVESASASAVLQADGAAAALNASLLQAAAAAAASGLESGIIIPPAEIKIVVDKTASAVAKHGRSFEDKILSSAQVR